MLNDIGVLGCRFATSNGYFTLPVREVCYDYNINTRDRCQVLHRLANDPQIEILLSARKGHPYPVVWHQENPGISHK